MTSININELIAEGPTQARQYDQSLAERYADAMNDGAVFPPVIVFRDGDGAYVADGFHRVGAAKKAKRDKVEADIRKPANGENAQRCAILYAVGANDEHGKARTQADKRYAVQMLLRDPEWSKWTDREIGRQVRVSHTFVRSQRDKMINSGATKPAATRKSRRGGKVTEVKSRKSRNRNPQKNKGLGASSGNVSTRQSEGWGKDDEKQSAAILNALAKLGEAWKAAGRPAQIHTGPVIQQTTREMK